jgi:hypothetical protein
MLRPPAELRRQEFTSEREAFFKQRMAPHLLVQSDIKWLSNVDNRPLLRS